MTDTTVLSEQYHELTGTDPEGFWFAPGRVNLIGEHTDYNDGFVLPFALDRKAVVAAGRRDDESVVMRSVEMDEMVSLPIGDLAPGASGWSAYLAGVVWALRQAGHDVGGVTLVLSSNVPLGAGLSSSAAIECAVVAACVDLFGLDIAPRDRAKLARVAENEYVGAPTGLLDQAASTLCRDGEALFLDCRSLETRSVPLPLAEQGLELLVLDTRTPHSHVDGEYADRRAACEQAAAQIGVAALRDVSDLDAALSKLDDPVLIKRTRHVVTENQRVLDALSVAEAGDLRQLAPLLDASHASMRDDFEITAPTVDAAVESARAAGALGARMTGGGFGGCIIALCRVGESQAIGQRIAHEFASRGWARPDWFEAAPSSGAGRLS